MKNNYVKENFSKPQDYLDGTQDELKSKIKILMNKLQITKKEKEILTKENQNLQLEILQMQSNLRCMVSGFANTSITFPMANELINSIAEFYKCECFDIFFDVLTQELNMQGIVYFFQTAMLRIDKIINDYFSPSFKNIIDVSCLTTIDGPILNVLRKSFQSNYKQIYEKCMLNLSSVKQELQKTLKLKNGDMIEQFLKKLSEIMFNCFISDPSLQFDIQSIGQRHQFNQTKNDPIDGFLKNKEECIILMPGVYKHQEQMAKSLVLSYSYQLENN
ncbi:unnamed protein product (macronuclear) [Paramecium tetraurelia]|uniref:Dilute domain-containing protein n=1 Tax=Paramecium tetraurelia TaxID=5888 RepID=A0DKP0_PARTE|nr:uncharacterized protein GSPATT00017937001 [Paramecium tetraurelia]CAK83607.1 unnamed protein product [Paramecium tetraurelia]|eukprot:XP_001451004.1 hypothetical protein (macronuclear) [Paramecium tetraurelia strain d4-2]